MTFSFKTWALIWTNICYWWLGLISFQFKPCFNITKTSSSHGCEQIFSVHAQSYGYLGRLVARFSVLPCIYVSWTALLEQVVGVHYSALIALECMHVGPNGWNCNGGCTVSTLSFSLFPTTSAFVDILIDNNSDPPAAIFMLGHRCNHSQLPIQMGFPWASDILPTRHCTKRYHPQLEIENGKIRYRHP